MNYELLINFLKVSEPVAGRRSSPTEYWKYLFDFYNSNRPKEERFLAMSCGICYHKVHHFCRMYLRQQADGEIKRLAGDINSLERLSKSAVEIAANIDGFAKELRTEGL